MNFFRKCSDYLGSFIYGEIETKIEKILDEIKKDQTRTENLEKELEKAKIRADKFKNLVVAIGDTIPDMMWSKDIDGRYIYFNNAIIKGLFYNMNYKYVLNLTDLEITAKCKLLVGGENHTFGEVCGNSDLVVLKNLKKERFLEWGLINGKEVYLEVYKAPFYRDGEVIGTVGTGRDVTEWYTSIRDVVLKNKCAKKPDCFGSLVLKELDKYKFDA